MPKTYVTECPDNCSLGPKTQYGPMVSEGLANGRSYRQMIAEASKTGGVIYPGTIGRHKKHVHITGRSTDPDDPLESVKSQATNIEILETIIQKGFQNSRNWKPTISDTMKAMDMWFRLTQGNPFDDLLDTLASASIGEEIEESRPKPIRRRFRLRTSPPPRWWTWTTNRTSISSPRSLDDPRGEAILGRSARKTANLFAKAFLPKKPHAGQPTWLTNSVEAINTLVPGNRWGKSTIIAEKHIHKCIFKEGLNVKTRHEWKEAEYETISVAHSADQAAIVFKEAKKLLKDSPLGVVRQGDADRRPSRTSSSPTAASSTAAARTTTASTSTATPTGICPSTRLAGLPNLKILMTNVIVMRLAGGGDIDLIGTPKGYNDLYFYYERGQRGTPGLLQPARVASTTTRTSRATTSRCATGCSQSADPKIRKQVLEGEFVDFTGLAFTRDQRDNAFDPVPAALAAVHRGSPLRDRRGPWPDDRLDRHRRAGHHRPSRGRSVRFTRLNKVAWEEIYATIDRVTKEYRAKFARIDATGPQGDVIEEEMTKRGIKVDPFKTSTRASKLDIINGLQSALDEGRQVVGEVGNSG